MIDIACSSRSNIRVYVYSCTHSELLSSMDEMKNLINCLHQKHSTLSLRSVASFAPSIKTKEAMKQQHHHRAGVTALYTADMIRNWEAHVVGVVQHPNVPPVVSQVIPQTVGPVIQGDEVVEERQKRKSGTCTSRTNSTPVRGTALHVAAEMGSTQGVQALLADGANIEGMSSVTDNKSTPLDTAAVLGRTDVVRLLLEKGANIEATRGDTGGTPLDSAAYFGHPDVVRLLLEKGANIEATGRDGGTPLDSAACNGHTDVVRLLLEKGAIIEAARNDGRTPLDSSVYNGHTDVVRLLLEKGANIQATRSSGSTALYSASWRGHVGVVSLLLEAGANIEAMRINNAQAALHAAALFLQTEVVQLLLEKGANIHAVTKEAKTVLHLVFDVPTRHSHLKDSKQLIPTITVLLAHGANILQQDDSGRTPLDLAEECGYLEAKQLLLQHIKERNLESPQGASLGDQSQNSVPDSNMLVGLGTYQSF